VKRGNKMTLFLFIVIAGAVYYFIIYKTDYKKLFHGSEEKKCPNCGNNVEKSFNVCPICKETLKRKCPNCKEMVEVSWKYCPYCESNLKQGDGR